MSIAVMLDTETMSTNYNAAIVQIGAVKFEQETGDIISEFTVNISLKDCIAKGLHYDVETMKWWQSRDPEVLKSLFVNPLNLEEALDKFSMWYGPKSMMTFVNGANFDFPIMESAYKSIDRKVPWKYWHMCDYRTITNLSGLPKEYFDEQRKKMGEGYHNALFDVKFQVKMLIEILK